MIVKYLRVSFMYRQLAAILLILLFATYHFNRVWIVLDYVANTEAFAKNCENKARPQLHCKGKCQMMKKLKEEEKKEQQNPSGKADKDEVVYAKPGTTTLFVSVTAVCQSTFSFSDTSFPQGIYTDIFHPPAWA